MDLFLNMVSVRQSKWLKIFAAANLLHVDIIILIIFSFLLVFFTLFQKHIDVLLKALSLIKLWRRRCTYLCLASLNRYLLLNLLIFIFTVAIFARTFLGLTKIFLVLLADWLLAKAALNGASPGLNATSSLDFLLIFLSFEIVNRMACIERLVH